MTYQKKITFSLDQQSHLDAWAAVYVEARADFGERDRSFR